VTDDRILDLFDDEGDDEGTAPAYVLVLSEDTLPPLVLILQIAMTMSESEVETALSLVENSQCFTPEQRVRLSKSLPTVMESYYEHFMDMFSAGQDAHPHVRWGQA
jgi:hypothetical protein